MYQEKLNLKDSLYKRYFFLYYKYYFHSTFTNTFIIFMPSKRNLTWTFIFVLCISTSATAAANKEMEWKKRNSCTNITKK